MPRLVYADWLDEQGRPGGEFLRVDCELAALDTAEFERQEQVRVFERQEQERAKLGEDGVIDSAPPDLLGAYYWQRVHLIAKMRCVIRGLADEWMAAVSRVPIEEINARVREIQSLLRRRVTVAEVLGQMTEWDKPPEPRRGLWLRVRRLFGRDTGHRFGSPNGGSACPLHAGVDRNKPSAGRRAMGVRHSRQ